MSVDLSNLVTRTIHDMTHKSYEVLDQDLYLFGALDWLKRAQDMTTDGGVSAQYDLLRGWDDSYIETTGYILVSFFDAANAFDDPELRARAIKMADFLVKVQLPSGAFASGTPQDLPFVPRVFNTGEVIRGLVRAYKETGKTKYLNSAKRAADWLVSIQEEDGSWIKDEFQNRKHTYHSRTAWALLTVWQATKILRYKQAATICLNWVLTKQNHEGWFSDCDFTSPPQPFTHAIDYVISGLLESGEILKNKNYIKAAQKASDKLLSYYMANDFMPATFDHSWQSADSYSCLTGNAQIVISWIKFYSRTKNKKYLKAASELLDDLKARVDLLTNDLNIRGALAGAYPIYGGYSRFNYPNWATKFFFEALLSYRSLHNK
jgi:hypothetical protein